MSLHTEIIDILSSDSSIFFYYSNAFLNCLDEYNVDSIPFSMGCFFSLYEKFIKNNIYKEVTYNFLSSVIPDEDLLEKFSKTMDQQYDPDRIYEPFKSSHDFSMFTLQEKEEIAYGLTYYWKKKDTHNQWKNEMFNPYITNLILIHQLLQECDKVDIFYEIVRKCTNVLLNYEYFQESQDIMAAIISTSFEDELAHIGFLNASMYYVRMEHPIAALLFLNLSLSAVRNKKHNLIYEKEVTKLAINIISNIGLFELVNKLNEIIPSRVIFSDKEKKRMCYDQFVSELKFDYPEFPTDLFNYLEKEKEAIINFSENEAMEWLMILYNIEFLGSPTPLLNHYIQLLEKNVSPELIEKHKGTIFGTSVELKNKFKEEFCKLFSTRDRDKFSYNIYKEVSRAMRLIKQSYEEKEPCSFLLAMIIKANLSMTIGLPENLKEINFAVSDFIQQGKIDWIYDDLPLMYEKLSLMPDVQLVWLGVEEREQVRQLSLLNQKWEFFSPSSDFCSSMQRFIVENSDSHMFFDDTVRDDSGIRNILLEEWQEQSNEIRSFLRSCHIFISNTAKSCYIIKDMLLANLPHNLLIDQYGDFISKKMPVTNIISTEWFMFRHKQTFNQNYSRTIWVPTEGGDFALNYLFSNIEKTLYQYNFNINTDSQL